MQTEIRKEAVEYKMGNRVLLSIKKLTKKICKAI